MDAETTKTVAQTATSLAAWHALGGKELLVKLLGPTADYVGSELKNLTEKGVQNVRRIVENAAHKIGPTINDPAVVAPKVVHKLLTDGFWVEDQISAEYYGGVLASSRTSSSRDDRGAYWLGVLERLTTYQIRAHCILYTSLYSALKIMPNTSERFQQILEGTKGLLVGRSALGKCLELAEGEDLETIVGHVFSGLQRERLLSEVIKSDSEGESKVTFSEDGIGLLLWSFGKGKKPITSFLDEQHPWPHLNSGVGGVFVDVTNGYTPTWL